MGLGSLIALPSPRRTVLKIKRVCRLAQLWVHRYRDAESARANRPISNEAVVPITSRASGLIEPQERSLREATSRLELATLLGRSAIHGVALRRAWRDIGHVFFMVGYARSGSTLVGSMLNAHPEAVIAHEADVFRYVRPGIHRNQLYAILVERDRAFAALSRRWHGYDYQIEGGSQGEFLTLRVIGDKHAGRTTRRLVADPDLLPRFRHTVGVPIRALHLVRNPYDMIASTAHHSGTSIECAIENFRWLSHAVDRAIGRMNPGELLELRYEDVIADPSTQLIAMCEFVGITASASYLQRCRELIGLDTQRSRYRVAWSKRDLQQVQGIIESRPILAGYAYDDVV
jgi:hypothetical protein